MKPATAYLESTFLSTRKPLLQLLKRRLGCSHAAEDLVQETYLRVIQQDSVEEIANLPAYLFRIASNLLIDHGRQATAAAQGHHEPLEDDLMCPKPLPDRLAETSQELELLNRLVAELPPRCRRIFLMHKVQHLSHVEIAAQLDISPRTVETQIGKALKILRDRMRTAA
jgi:RNA polymerase sigma factor (sigma-70 family)